MSSSTAPPPTAPPPFVTSTTTTSTAPPTTTTSTSSSSFIIPGFPHPRVTPVASTITLLSIICTLPHMFGLVSKDAITTRWGLDPGSTVMQTQIWTLLTCVLVQDVLSFCVIPLLHICVAELEREWGWKRLGKFLGLQTLFSSVCGLLMQFLAFAWTRKEAFFFSAMFGCGGLATSAGLALISHKPGLKVYNIEVRLLVLPTIVFFCLVRVGMDFPFADLTFVLYNFFSGVYRLSGEQFGIDMLFPDPMHVSVRGAVERIMPSILSSSAMATIGSSSNSSSSHHHTIGNMHIVTSSTNSTTSHDAVADRRRARAMQALDKKLAELEKAEQVDLEG